MYLELNRLYASGLTVAEMFTVASAVMLKTPPATTTPTTPTRGSVETLPDGTTIYRY